MIIFFNGILPDHFILHSLIGAVSIGTLISIFVTVFLYPILSALLFSFDKVKIKEVCRLTPTLIVSCMLGNLFHILLDMPMHPFNPILWPFVDSYKIIGILVLVFAINGDIVLGFLYARILTNTIMALLSIAIIVRSRKNLWNLILVGKTNSQS